MAKMTRNQNPSGGNSARMMTMGSMGEPENALSGMDAPYMEADSVTSDPTSLGAPDLDSMEPAPDNQPQADPAQEPANQATQPADQPTAEEIDDPRFKGKSAAEIYKALKNAESMAGKHAQEVGVYRDLFEKKVLAPMVQQQAPSAQEPEVNPEDEAALLNEMLTKPKQFMARVQNDMLSKLNQVATQGQTAKLYEQNRETVESPEFKQWLVANVPQHVAAQADRDPNTFKFVMNSYRAASGQPAPAPTIPPATAQVAAPAAPAERRLPVGAAVGVSAGAPVATPKQSYTFSQLAQMQLNNPHEYARLQPEIMAAYQEGRVRR
jgi:hypothetical protein